MVQYEGLSGCREGPGEVAYLLDPDAQRPYSSCQTIYKESLDSHEFSSDSALWKSMQTQRQIKTASTDVFTMLTKLWIRRLQTIYPMAGPDTSWRQ